MPRSRDRTGSYLISLCVGAAIFGMFFFLTIFVQNVCGYGPLAAIRVIREDLSGVDPLVAPAG